MRRVFCIPTHRRAVAVVTALLVVPACDAGDPNSNETDSDSMLDGDADEEPRADGLLELGAFGSSRQFVAYQPGDEEEIEMGLQGGFHFFVDGRLRPEDAPSELVLQIDVFRTDDRTEITSIRHQRLPDIADAQGWPTLPELIVFIPSPEQVVGSMVDVSVRAEALDGTLLDIVQTRLVLVSAT